LKKEKLKSPYLDPELEILRFSNSDVIATSGGGDRFDWGSSGGSGNEDTWT
jgi:hypothetical protein